MTTEENSNPSPVETLEPEREDRAVDIHKPKPVRSWREFLSEIGVIVIGVAIALAGEQVVEAIHWRHVVEAQRHALRQGAVDNFTAVKMRAVQQGCVDARLAQLETVFERHAAGKPLRLKGRVGRPQNATVGNEVWQLAVQSEALDHMPMDERALMAAAFSNFENLRAIRDDVDGSWVDLAALNRPELLREGDWVELRRSFGRVVAKEARVRNVTEYVLGGAREMGMSIPKITLNDVLYSDYAKDFCNPLI